MSFAVKLTVGIPVHMIHLGPLIQDRHPKEAPTNVLWKGRHRLLCVLALQEPGNIINPIDGRLIHAEPQITFSCREDWAYDPLCLDNFFEQGEVAYLPG
jgi:hypothetical protein